MSICPPAGRIRDDAGADIGRAFMVDFDAGAAARADVLRQAEADAREALPPGQVFELRAKEIPADRPDLGVTRGDLAQCWGVAWYAGAEIDDAPLFNRSVDDGIAVDGYRLVARLAA